MSKSDQKDFISSVLSTQEAYKVKSKAYLSAIQKNDKDIIAFIITVASTILTNKKKHDPMVFLNILRFLKEAMDQQSEDFILKFQSSLLSAYADLGKFRQKDPDDTRGRFLFSDKPDKQLEIIGNSCLRLILECIMMWPGLFPFDSKKNPTKFKATFENLKKAGVSFPKEVNYFKKKKNEGNPIQGSVVQKPANNNDNIQKNNNLNAGGRIKEIEEKIEENRNYKELLLNIMSVKKESEMEEENLNLIYDYFKQYLKQTENFLNILLSEQNDEKLLANVFMDQEFAQNLINDINNFRSKTLKFNDFKAKYVAIIAKENQTATPQPDNQPNRDIEAAQEKIEDNQNPSLLKPQLPKPQSQQNFEGDESPILEKNESLHHSQNKEKENPFMHEEEEENINIIGKQSGFKEIEKQSGIIDKHSGYLPQKETYDKQLSEKSSRIPEENSFKQNKIRPSSRRSSQVSNHNKSERNLSYQDPYNNEMHQQKQSHISSHDKPLTQSKGHNYHSEYQDEDKPEPNIYSHSDLREDKSKGLNYQSEIIENQKDSHSYSTKGLNYQSEFIKNKADSNPYNFRSVIARKDPSPNKASFQKLFKIEENHKIDPKKPSLNQIIPRNEEKISQIMNAKDIDRFSETSEKQQRSEIFDYNDVKNENQGLKEENHELKNKLSNIMNSYQETEKILAKLKMENEILQERRSSDYKEEYNSRKEEEIAEGNIDRLQQNNEALRIENQALNDYINRQQFENEQLKKNLDKHSFGNPTTEDFETIEILKKENQALRNYLMEYKLKVEENKSDLRDFEALNNLKKENEELKTHLNEIKQSKLLDTKLDNQLRNSVISHENFEFEDPKIQENLAGTSSFQTKFMFHNNPITNKTTIPKPFTISNNNKTTTIAQNSNNKKNSHWVKASNEFPDEEEEKENYNVPGSNSHIKNSKDISHYSISPHKKIFDKAPPLDTEDLRKSIEASSEKKKKSHEGSHNQSMEDYQNQRLSNYLKKSGKFSKNESQKSANTEQNRSFEENNNEKIMLNQSQKKGPVIVKSSMPYDGPRNFEENFDTNSILNSSLISITQANLRFEDSPYQTDLIYPFQKPSDYYQGKKANKSFKGFLIQLEKGSVFEEIEKNLRENSFRFKLSCLRNKSMFFDNNTLQLGLISGIYPHDQKSLLKMTVYFGNLTKFEINDFKIMYTGSSAISLWTKPEIMNSDIASKMQAKQDLLIDFNSIPYPFIIARCSYNFQGTPVKFALPIPMTLNKFLQPKITDSSTFKYKWKANDSSIFKSEVFDLNPRIAKSVYDFKKYFPNFIDLTPQKEYDYVSGVEDYKLCGVFEIGQDEILLKVVTQPNKKALFQVVCKNGEKAEFLLKTLVFIFRK